MSGYNYGPPPPPPPSSTSGPPSSYSFTGGAYQPPIHTRGGGRGRGGHYASAGRGDYHAPQPAYTHASQQYQSPQDPRPPYSSSYAPPASYPQHQTQWPATEHSHAVSHNHPHASAPISTANYHPTYTPQSYPHPHYPPQPSYPPSQPYAQHYQGGPPPSVAQWHGQSHPSRGRGGGNGRSVPPQVRGYDHAHASPPSTASYGQPYAQDPRPNYYPPQHYAYPAPPAAPLPSRNDSQSTNYPRRGRGGLHRGSAPRGRGGHRNEREHERPQKQKHKVDAHEPKSKPEPPSTGKKKKRKVNTLGLTPGMDSETEDDEGEEKSLQELIGPEALSVNDVAAYIAERKKNFPTKAKIEAKRAAELAQRNEDKASLLEKQADALRKQLRKVESSIKRKREQGDEGDEMRVSSGNSSENGEPEVLSSRKKSAPSTVDKRADISRHCKYYSTGGTCGKKGKCRFVHDPEIREAAMKEREANNGRLTIQQRLILNDKEQEDLTVLRSIQYLRGKGIMAPTSGDDTKESDNDEDAAAKSQSKTTSKLLPAAPESLPAPPQKTEATGDRQSTIPTNGPSAHETDSQEAKHYEGWLLQPYGNSDGTKKKN